MLFLLTMLACPLPEDLGKPEGDTGGDTGEDTATPAPTGDPCAEAGLRMQAKYESCGIELEPDEEPEDVECTEELAAQATCVADCIVAADCGVLDMSNTDYTGEAWTSYTECTTACM